MPSTATVGVRAGGFISIDREWEGKTAFLICGGMSVNLANLETLRGRRVVVVNSAVYTAPWADILFFADYETWGGDHKTAVKSFEGRRISASWGSVHCEYIEFLRRPKPADVPPGLSSDPGEVFVRHTSARGAINLLCHLGVKTIVTLGLDGGPDASGKTHHHRAHSRGLNPDIWALQRPELAAVAPALAARGVKLLNASPGSKIPFWPIVNLEDVI